MDNKNRDRDLADLMSLGKAGPNDQLLSRITAECGDGLFRGNESCEKIAGLLTNEQMYDLFRGLVLADNRLRYGRSSVSPAVWFARVFSERCPEFYPEATRWLSMHCENDWVRIHPSPFYDYVNMRPMTEAECQEVRRAEAQRQEEQRQREEEEARAVAERRALRAAEARRNEERNKTVQAARREQRTLILESLATVAPIERLCRVVSDESVGLDFYPATWGILSPEQRKQVPLEAIEALLRRSQEAAGKSWREVAKLFRGDQRSGRNADS